MPAILRNAPARPHAYRFGSRFIAAADVAAPLSYAGRERLRERARRLERETKPKGRKSGVLGLSGLAVLDALLGHANRRTGACEPSIGRLEEVTGLCRETVCKALARLERAGLIQRIRRVVRRPIARLCAITGRWIELLATVQTTNAYAFPGARAAEPEKPPQIARPAPTEAAESTVPTRNPFEFLMKRLSVGLEGQRGVDRAARMAAPSTPPVVNASASAALLAILRRQRV